MELVILFPYFIHDILVIVTLLTKIINKKLN